MDDKRKEAGQKLLEAAQEFWDSCHLEGQYGAVQWLTGTRGELVIYTRGEYLATLLNNIHQLGDQKAHYFQGETMPSEDNE